MLDEQIQAGWRRDVNDYTTACPYPECAERFGQEEESKGSSGKSGPPIKQPVRFVARFAVSSKAPFWEGSTGAGSKLFCEYLAPWVLMKDFHKALTMHGTMRWLPAWVFGLWSCCVARCAKHVEPETHSVWCVCVYRTIWLCVVCLAWLGLAWLDMAWCGLHCTRAFSHSSGDAIVCSPEFRHKCPTVFWNLVWFFEKHHLPLEFLVPDDIAAAYQESLPDGLREPVRPGPNTGVPAYDPALAPGAGSPSINFGGASASTPRPTSAAQQRHGLPPRPGMPVGRRGGVGSMGGGGGVAGGAVSPNERLSFASPPPVSRGNIA